MSDYKNRNGNPVTLEQLCTTEPEWAANRIRTGLAEIERLRSRRPVVCETCEGDRFTRLYPDGECPDCGKDGCGKGVRWEDA